MSVVRITIEARALEDQTDPRIPTWKKGDFVSWGSLIVRHLLTDDGPWTFDPDGLTQSWDDFWGAHKLVTEGKPGERLTFSNDTAQGRWTNQVNMNLILWSERPKSRQAMVLLGFTPPVLRVGSQGVGTMVRGNSKIRLAPNPVIGRNGQEIVERTDGSTMPIRWRVNTITDDLGYINRLELVEK